MEIFKMEILSLTSCYAVFPLLLMLVYVAILIYLITLAARLVKAVEKIADKIGPPSNTPNM